MPSNSSDQQYGQALLDSVRNGSYPESEDVISAELPPTAIPGILKLLKQAREDVKVRTMLDATRYEANYRAVKASIRETSKNSAQDIDGWISQAKQLRDDIEDSRGTARHIVELDKDGEQLRIQSQDAASKVDLLVEEVAFTESLIAVYERVGRLRRRLDITQEALQRDQFDRAARELLGAETEVESLRTSPNTRVITVMRARLGSLRNDIAAQLLDHWKCMIRIDLAPATVTIKHQSQGSSPLDLDTLAKALHKLGLLDDTISMFCRDLERAIVRPLLQSHSDESVGSISIDREILTLADVSTTKSIEDLFTDVSKMIEYLSTNLPALVAAKIPEFLSPTLFPTITSTWLSSAVPSNLDGIEGFQNTVESVLRFAAVLERYKWPGKAWLVNWTKETPHLWLNKRQEYSLDKVRRLLASGLRDVETVERVETQILSKKEDLSTSAGGDDNWNAEWSDEDEPTRSGAALPASANEESAEEDVSAWGLDEDANGGDHDPTSEKAQHENEDAGAWGWDDEEEGGETIVWPKPVQAGSKYPRSNGILDSAHGAQREVTLKETYNITALPKDVLELITQALCDAETLRKPTYNILPIASASKGLFALPGLILTMYRASAPSCYSLNPSGNMFLYNDSLWLAERLLQYSKDHSNPRVKLHSDISALSTFGKRAYGREMESQRTILSDLLDGAQGFSNCTEPPFAQECDLAISSTVDRLREVYRQWHPVLSHSALLQSLGSLLSTVINKIIVDVEDMSDISEPESQRLTVFCNRVASLEDLFLPERPAEAQETEQASMPLTAVYTPGWLKFQYLVNILESSLVDIKFLWEEGELGLEFDVEELVELIEALFADSEHRRRAIGDIRRVSGSG